MPMNHKYINMDVRLASAWRVERISFIYMLKSVSIRGQCPVNMSIPDRKL
jgi:hypothetical protein